jgi:hypothetical protein
VSKPTTFNEIVPDKLMRQSRHFFQCPYCEHTWERGGSKEGFVKVAAWRHVGTCREVLLFRAGYVAIGQSCPADGARNSFVTKIVDLDPANDWHMRVKRQMTAASRTRARDYPGLK